MHVPLRPVGTAETVLRKWVTGAPLQETEGWGDPAAAEPVRVRAGAVVIRDAHMLLIGFEDEEHGGPSYEIPGGGVEKGETLHAAVLRELREETGPAGTVAQELARVWKDGRREHYFLVHADGEVGDPAELDNGDGAPV